jgi:hypothetical protein
VDVQESVSFASGRVRLLQLTGRLVTEDHLDKRWEAGTGEQVEEIIFLSRHVAASNRPALTVHPIGEFVLLSLRPSLSIIWNQQLDFDSPLLLYVQIRVKNYSLASNTAGRSAHS